ncbi:MAG: TetR/AcrR family transcriptional regulator [Halioglobus sp.]|nr:TetR/AcrR family transcriptional regulator [Halioglobus sp.]
MSASPKLSKRELTRRRVIEAAIDCIYELGFNAAHTNRIAAAAGVSWGVLQYHFGDKDGLLQAVLDEVFEDFSSTLRNTELRGETLRERTGYLIEVVWSLVSKREYRVSVAILRNAGKDENSSLNGEKQVANWTRTTSRLWDRLFEDDQPDPQRSEIARHLVFAALRGMADEINPASRSSKAKAREREALAEAITFLLSD